MASELKVFIMTIGSIYSSANSSLDFVKKIASKYFQQFIRELFLLLKKHEQNVRQVANGM